MVPTIHHTEYPWWYFHCTTDMSTSYVGYILPLQNIPRLSKRFRHYENTFTRSNLQLNYQFQLIPLIYYIPTLMIFLKKPTSISEQNLSCPNTRNTYNAHRRSVNPEYPSNLWYSIIIQSTFTSIIPAP